MNSSTGPKNRKDDTTVVFTDIRTTLATAEKEAADRPAALLAMGGELNGTLFDLLNGTMTIGRNPHNTFSLEFPGISREHLKIIIHGDMVEIEDMGSRNGTYLNNEKIEGRKQLKKQDVVKIGNIAFRFLPKGDPDRLAYDQLNHQVNTDALTQCFNKNYFYRKCDDKVRVSKATGAPLSLIVFDLDHFKKLNDNFGHDAGDYVLKELSNIIRSNGVREQDIFARYGGEEFVILLPNTNIKQAYQIAERIRELSANYDFTYDQKKLPVTISVGIADFRQGVNNGVELFKRADKALYKSKEGGRNQVNFYKD